MGYNIARWSLSVAIALLMMFTLGLMGIKLPSAALLTLYIFEVLMYAHIIDLIADAKHYKEHDNDRN